MALLVRPFYEHEHETESLRLKFRRITKLQHASGDRSWRICLVLVTTSRDATGIDEALATHMKCSSVDRFKIDWMSSDHR